MISRRQMIERSMFATAAFSVPGAFAEQLETVALTEGPFYPDKMPLDTDNDLLVINDSVTPAVGEITHLSGRVLSKAGSPLRNAFVEIWQVDNEGVYLHSGDNNNRENQDKNFQGYGRFLTDVKGNYYFRTIKPKPYPGRTPHIHIAVSMGGKRILTTQILVKGEKQNQNDGVFKQVKDPAARDTVLAEFKPMNGSKIGELTADFDIQLGKTIEELEDEKITGVAQPTWGRRR